MACRRPKILSLAPPVKDPDVKGDVKDQFSEPSSPFEQSRVYSPVWTEDFRQLLSVVVATFLLGAESESEVFPHAYST